MEIPGPDNLIYKCQLKKKAVLAGPVFNAPVTEVPVMVSCKKHSQISNGRIELLKSEI